MPCYFTEGNAMATAIAPQYVYNTPYGVAPKCPSKKNVIRQEEGVGGRKEKRRRNRRKRGGDL